MDAAHQGILVGATVVVLSLTWTPPAAWSAPVTVEESEKIVSPETQFPLNGPVALGGNVLVAGSTAADETPAPFFNSAVYVFERSTPHDPWAYITKLIQLGPFEEDDSHLSVALEGGTAAVSADDVTYVFERAAGWSVTATLTRPAGTEDFGSDVAISGSRLVVGGISGGRWTGHVYQKNASGQWAPAGNAVAGDTGSVDAQIIGAGVAIDGDRVLIGSPAATPRDPDDPGRALVFADQPDGTWLQGDALTGEGADDLEGRWVDMHRPFAAMNSGRGVLTFEEFEPDAWGSVGRVAGIDSLMNDPSALGLNEQFLDITSSRIATGAPGDEDRGARSGSVTVYAGFDPSIARAKLLASDASPDLRLGGYVSIDGNAVAASSRDGVYLFDAPATFPQIQPPPFQDTFEDGDSAGWLVQSSIWNVVQSSGSRVYLQTRTTGDALSVLGNTDLTNQSVQVDVRPLSFSGADRWVGLLTRYTDDHNNYYVTLRSSNRVELGKRVKNDFTTLDSAPITVRANRRYRFRFEAIGTWLRVYVDGVLMLEAQDSSLPHGTVGLRTASARAEYDNVVVSGNPQITLRADDFENEALASWRTETHENWSNADSGGNRVIRQSTIDGGQRAITGVESNFPDTLLADQIIEARGRALGLNPAALDPWFGLIARYRNNDDYVYVTVNRNDYISLRKLVDGAIHVFDQAPFTVDAGVWYSLRLEAIGQELRVYVNGRLMLEGTDGDVSSHNRLGELYGLMTSRLPAEFDNVKVVQP